MISKATSTSGQAIDKQKSEFMQKTANDEVQRSYNHYAQKEGFDHLKTKQYARAEAATRLRQLHESDIKNGGPGNYQALDLAQNLSDMNTAEMQAQRELELKNDATKAEIRVRDAQAMNQERGYLESLTIEELETELQLAQERGLPTAKYEGLIKLKREKQEQARLDADYKREDLRLRQAKEKRLANQLNSTEFGVLKEVRTTYDEGSKLVRTATELGNKVRAADEAGRSVGVWSAIEEGARSILGIEDIHSVTQAELEAAALERAFSYKQAGAMSDAEAEMYKAAAIKASASPEAWLEFLRLDAIAGERMKRKAAWEDDYISGADMGEQGYVGVRPVEAGVPRGMDGMTKAWDANTQKIEDDIQKEYSRENWGTITGSYDKPGANPEEPLTEANLRRKWGTTPPSVEESPTYPNLPGTL
jgi:hypothetical protein